jgi:hypothetical protein
MAIEPTAKNIAVSNSKEHRSLDENYYKHSVSLSVQSRRTSVTALSPPVKLPYRIREYKNEDV